MEFERLRVERSLADYSYATRLAERAGNIYWEREFRNRFEFIAGVLEEAEDISLRDILKPYRLLMVELN